MATRSRQTPFWKSYDKAHHRVSRFRAKRPHRSFRVTPRHDALQPLKLPGYWAFTLRVNKTILQYKRLLLSLAVIYALFYALIIGIGSQETYVMLADSFQETGQELLAGSWNQLAQAGLLFVSVASSGLNAEITATQQAVGLVLILFVWLTVVWMLRRLLNGQQVRLRDALYSAGAPIIPTAILAGVIVVQLIPLAVAAIAYSAADATGLLLGGVETMLFWFAAGALAILSLYWITSTFFAMIITTLPGTYPFRALSIAGDMLVGRRLKVLLRWLWMAFVIILFWAVVLIPVILFDGWMKGVWDQISWVPIVPIAALALSSLTTVWASGYIYLLYRQIVDEDARRD